MTTHPDLRDASARIATLVVAIPPDELGAPTPCERYTVGDLLDHIAGAGLAFAAAACKEPLEGAPSGNAANLAPDWRTRIPRDLAALTEAWRDPAAWTGMTRVGGVDLPGEIAGAVALDELVIHGWDLAKSIGRPAGYDGPELQTVLTTVQGFRAAGIDGLFGPPVEVAADAPLLDQILGLAGRDPDWLPTR